MQQQYSNYTTEHQWVWQQLFTRQLENLKTKGTALFYDSAVQLNEVFHDRQIPVLSDLSDALLQRTGWQIHIVPGFIPATDFLGLLSEKKFSASTWLRSPAQLDYLEEPDMFHDIFGHLPILADKAYAAFVHEVGELGHKYAHNHACIDFIERFYWYTIEFGLIKENEETKIYGAGIISSFGETNRIFEDKTIDIRPFNLEEILYLPFDKSSLQPVYYLAESYEQLYASLNDLKKVLEEKAAEELIPVS